MPSARPIQVPDLCDRRARGAPCPCPALDVTHCDDDDTAAPQTLRAPAKRPSPVVTQFSGSRSSSSGSATTHTHTQSWHCCSPSAPAGKMFQKRHKTTAGNRVRASPNDDDDDVNGDEEPRNRPCRMFCEPSAHRIERPRWIFSPNGREKPNHTTHHARRDKTAAAAAAAADWAQQRPCVFERACTAPQPRASAVRIYFRQNCV